MTSASGPSGEGTLSAFSRRAAAPSPAASPVTSANSPRASSGEAVFSQRTPFARKADINLPKPCEAAGPGALSVTTTTAGGSAAAQKAMPAGRAAKRHNVIRRHHALQDIIVDLA